MVRVLGLVLLLITLACPAVANDAEMGGSGSDLVPLQNSVIRMVSEDILLDEAMGEGFRVTARYQFENPTDAPVKVTMGFPERVCQSDYECGEGQRFLDMKTTLRGKVVGHQVGQVSRDHAWSGQFGDVWLYEVTFAPNEKVAIEHSYRLWPGGSVAGDFWVDYVTRTGALWSGPIGEARFTIRIGYPALFYRLESPFPIAEVKMHKVGEREVLDLVLVGRDIKPASDISLTYAHKDYFLTWSGLRQEATGELFTFSRGAERAKMYGQHCEKIEETHHESATLDPKNQLALDQAAENLAASGADLRICRNAIFARHGRIFADPSLNLYFYGSEKPDRSKRPYFPFEPNPEYEKRQLFASDWRTLAVIARAQELHPPKTHEPSETVRAQKRGAPTGVDRIQTVRLPAPSTRGGCSLVANTPPSPSKGGGILVLWTLLATFFLRLSRVVLNPVRGGHRDRD